MIKSEQIVSVVQVIGKYRNELIRMVVLLLLTSVLVYYKSIVIINLLAKSLNNQPLFFLTPVEGVMVRVKIALLGGIIISLPIIAYRILYLCKPRITKKTKRMIAFLIFPFAIIAFLGGVIFSYFFVLPVTMNFLLSCGNEFMKPALSGNDYFSFVSILLVAIGAIFELPFIIVALFKLRIVSYKLLSDKRKIAILLIVIIVAVITPTPDAFTLCVVAAPMIILYEISVWWVFMLERKHKKSQANLSIR